MTTTPPATIAKPVRVTNPGGEFWRVEDANGKGITDTRSQSRAMEIATALNSYASMKAALHAVRWTFTPQTPAAIREAPPTRRNGRRLRG